jgi:hypothetical protein
MDVSKDHPILSKIKLEYNGRFYKKLNESYGWSFPIEHKELILELLKPEKQVVHHNCKDQWTQTEEECVHKTYKYDIPMEFRNFFQFYKDLMNK